MYICMHSSSAWNQSKMQHSLHKYKKQMNLIVWINAIMSLDFSVLGVKIITIKNEEVKQTAFIIWKITSLPP